ncbi:hypothetical protein IG631_24047 [Alternaria alternata]|nr:hypothetical protein IG631_24047 [Alternaria alternata]
MDPTKGVAKNIISRETGTTLKRLYNSSQRASAEPQSLLNDPRSVRKVLLTIHLMYKLRQPPQPPQPPQRVLPEHGQYGHLRNLRNS